jgi:hypothetical protein
MPFRIILIAVLVLFFVAPAHSYVEWDIHCSGAQTDFEGTVGVFNQYVEGDVTGYELLFEQLAIGTCETPEVFLTVPLHASLSYAQYSISRPVLEANQYYRFRVLLRNPDGMVQDVGFPGAPSWNVVSCGEAVAARGFLVSVDEYGVADLEPCPGSCDTWSCVGGIDLSMIPEGQWLPLVGTEIAIDIYGSYVLYPMAGSPCMYGESLIPTTSEVCGPVSVESESWSGVKARYR